MDSESDMAASLQASLAALHRSCLVAPFALVLAGLAGCVAPWPKDILDSDFRLRGRVGIQDGERTLSASFDWRQAGERFSIRMWGPFGQGRIALSGNGDVISIAVGRGAIVEGEDPGRLMRQTLGWSLPVRALQRWITGSVDPGAQATRLSRQGDGTLAFEQHGWLVELSAWQETAIGAAPGRLVATRNGRRIVVLCKDWTFD